MKLHEQTQRFILLLIFYLFGPILTLGIIGGIVVRKHSFHARSWERSLTQQTGLHWAIQSVEYRSPGFVRLHEVKILEETAVFHAKKIDVRLITDTPQPKAFPGILPPPTENTGLTQLLEKALPLAYSPDRYWQISVPVSVLNFGQYSSEDSASLVQSMLHKVFARFASLSEEPVQLTFDEIALISERSLKNSGNTSYDKVDIFRFVQGNIYRTPKEIRSDWAFQIKDISELDWEHRERLSFTLSPTNTFEVSFHTGGQPVPCDLAAVFYSPFQYFSDGSFRGEFSVSTQIGSHSPTIRLNQAVFKDVPLAPLVSPYTEFAVNGTIVDFQLENAIFGTEEPYAEGCLQVKDGAIEKALFHRCVDRFQLTVEPDSILESPMPMVPFTACVIHFRLLPDGIDFWANQLWRDSFMYYRESSDVPETLVVFLPAQRRTVTYPELMSIFASDGTPVVPLIPGFQALVPCLPMR
ncbi:MAG: hypothetical protein LBI05_08955 [Planctomycetaceae bacterium]|jgi:hypothetical protein|nr:hypothetical protein [Planctomycetaceae bacterium]